jgi:hypothetical protein
MRNSAAIHGKVAITRRRQLYDWISQGNYSGAGAAQAPSIVVYDPLPDCLPLPEGNRGRPKVTMGLRMILTMDFVSPRSTCCVMKMDKGMNAVRYNQWEYRLKEGNEIFYDLLKTPHVRLHLLVVYSR